MNQPTRDEHEELKKRVAKLERQTEPMRIMRLEIDAGSIYRQLDSIQEDVGVFKTQIEGERADISIVKSNQGDLKEYIEGQFKSVETKQDTHQELLGQLLDLAELNGKTLKEHTQRFDCVESKLDLILKLLQPRGE